MKITIALIVTVLIALAGGVWRGAQKVNAMDNERAFNTRQNEMSLKQIELNTTQLKEDRYERLRIRLRVLEGQCDSGQCDAEDVESLVRQKMQKERYKKELGY